MRPPAFGLGALAFVPTESAMCHPLVHPPPSVAPYLFYDDVGGAARFIEEAFGFARIFESPAPEGGLAHAQLAHGSSKVMLGKTGEGLRMVKSARSMDALHWGDRMYCAVDPEGQFWMFARLLP